MTRPFILLCASLLLASCAGTQHNKKDVRDALQSLLRTFAAKDYDGLFDLMCRDNREFYDRVIELARGKDLSRIKREDAFTKAAILTVLTEYDEKQIKELTARQLYLTCGEGNYAVPKIPGKELDRIDYEFDGDTAYVIPPKGEIPEPLERAFCFVKDEDGWRFDALRFAREYVKWLLKKQTGKEVPEALMSQAADIQLEGLLGERDE